MISPPGNSLDPEQGGVVADAGSDLPGGVRALLDRVREELDYNTAKGESGYRLGLHDGLRFAEEALADLLRRHGEDAAARPRPQDA